MSEAYFVDISIHRSHDVEGNTSCEICQIFLVNAFPPKPLDIAASNFTGA